MIGSNRIVAVKENRTMPLSLVIHSAQPLRTRVQNCVQKFVPTEFLPMQPATESNHQRKEFFYFGARKTRTQVKQKGLFLNFASDFTQSEPIGMVLWLVSSACFKHGEHILFIKRIQSSKLTKVYFLSILRIKRASMLILRHKNYSINQIKLN